MRVFSGVQPDPTSAEPLFPMLKHMGESGMSWSARPTGKVRTLWRQPLSHTFSQMRCTLGLRGSKARTRSPFMAACANSLPILAPG